MIRLRRITAIAGKEFLQLMRDRLTFAMVVGIPVMQMLLFGYAIEMDVRDLPIAVADNADTQLSRNLIASAEATQVVKVVARVETAAQIKDLLRQGRVTAGIVIPHDFEVRAARGGRASAQLLVDAGDPVVFNISQALVFLPLQTHAVPRSVFDRWPPTFEVRAYYNPERRTEVQVVPGLIGVILTLTMVLFTSVAIVREKERGNLEFLITTPVRTPELMLGKIFPFILIGLIQVAIILAVGVCLFRVPINGSLIDLYIGSLLFIAASLTFGLLISTFANNQFQAFQLTLMIFLPSILLSGFMFPYAGMPLWAQRIAEVLPLTHFLRIVRGILLRGATLADLAPALWALALFFFVTMTIAILRFRKRLD